MRCDIHDTGIGISPDTQAQLFQPFVQANSSTSRRFGGTGPGLGDLPALATAMSGRIGFESTIGEGSHFWVTMKFRRQSGRSPEFPAISNLPDIAIGPQDQRVADSGTTPRGERILVAEDNVVNQQVALGNLRKLGFYNTAVAGNGQEVLSLISSTPYDIILMDCQMPELDGYETTRRIRQSERNDHRTWIIAVTANVMVSDRQTCLEAGMDDYVSKP